MTDVIEMIDPAVGEIIDEQQLVEQLLKQAKEEGDLDRIGEALAVVSPIESAWRFRVVVSGGPMSFVKLSC